MAEAPNRKCVICGTKYRFCSNCGTNKNAPQTWKNIYHDEACKALAEIWHEYRDLNNGMSKEKARKLMEKYPENLSMVLQNPSFIGDEFREIFDIKQEQPDDAVNDDTVHETVQEEVHVENQKDEDIHDIENIEVASNDRKPQNKKNDYKKNK